MRPASEEAVKARDAALLERLRIGPATLEQLYSVMPAEDGHEQNDREVACSSALIRLSVKKQVRAVNDGWALV